MRSTRLVTVTLPADQLGELNAFAAADRRSRSSVVAIAVDEFLARQRVAGQERLLQLERLAGAPPPTNVAPEPSQAARAHVRDHAALGGFDRTTNGEPK